MARISVTVPAPFGARTVYVETHGCQMNAHDSEKALAKLRAAGFFETSDPSSADMVLLNTCSVREKASEKVFHRLRALNAHRELGDRIVGVMGCVAQAEAGAIFDRAPGVRIVVGPQAIDSLPDLVAQIDAGFPRAIDLRQENRPDFVDVSVEARRPGPVAFVTIIEGCNKNCSYCIVPYTRGRERSRAADGIIEEMRQLARAGYKEVHLLGQNVNSYADWMTRPSGRRFEENAFPELLERAARESGIPRIKYTTSHPRDFSPDIVRVMDENPELCNWIHLPVQSGSNATLKRMYRGYTREHYLSLIEVIKAAKRDYTLTSDIIVGFPGESDADFQETLDLVRLVEYDSLYTFNYSPRPHTPAASMADDVPPDVKRERFQALISLQESIQNRRYQRHVGSNAQVLIEGRSTRDVRHAMGHDTGNNVVNLVDGGTASAGQLAEVRITEAKAHSLFGELKEIVG